MIAASLLFQRILLSFTILALTVPGVIAKPSPNEFEGGDSLALHCFYLHGEKYQLDQEGKDAEIWKKGIIPQFAKPDSVFGVYDLFTHRGGGPMGAEWNSDGTLWVVGVLEGKPGTIESCLVFLNGKRIEVDWVVEESDSGTLLHFELGQDLWFERMAPIARRDYPLIYSSEDIRAGKGEPGLPLGVGEIVKLRLEVVTISEKQQQKVTVERAFHWAGGE